MIQFIKLTTGEDLIGDVNTVSDENGTRIKIRKPVQLIFTGQGTAMVSFCPWVDDDIFEFTPSSVMIHKDITMEVLNAYNKKFGIDIIVPSTAETQKIINPSTNKE